MSGIETWSTTPANNNQSPPFGWPAGILPSQVEPIGRQMMTSLAAWYQAAEWINYNLTPTYVSATQFTLTGNDTAIYHVGRRVKATDGSTNVYGTITASAFTTLTTVTVVWDSGVLQTGVTIVYVGITSAVNTSAPALSASAFANPSAAIGLTAINGSATTAMRSDAAPALSQAISPTWTGNHSFTKSTTMTASSGTALAVTAVSGQSALSLTGAANAYTEVVQANGTTSQSYGLLVRAGTNSSDLAFSVQDAAAAFTRLFVRGDGSGGLGSGGGALTWNAAGNLIVAAPGSGAAFAATGAANSAAVTATGSSTSGQSKGIFVNAGTTSADFSLLIQNLSGSSNYFQVRGDGLVQAVDQGGALQDVGWRDAPQNSTGGSYTTVLQDRGKSVVMVSAGATLTLAANASVAYPLGTVIVIVNNSAGSITISSSDSTVLAGTGTSGARTLAANGVASALKVAATTWFISGSGLS
jgi:hypothetical protein